MNYKSIISCVCVCLTPTLASATTVWSADLVDDVAGGSWRMYVVTSQDELGLGITPTGIYIDSLLNGAIEPTALLTNTALTVRKGSGETFDVVSFDSLAFASLDALPDGTAFTLSAGYLFQSYVLLNTSVVCSEFGCDFAAYEYEGIVEPVGPSLITHLSPAVGDSMSLTAVATTAPVPPPVIDDTAMVADDAVIGNGSTVGAYTVIEKGVYVGGNSTIGSNVTISKDTHLGDNTVVGDGSTINKDVIAGDYLTVGTNVTIHKDVIIGVGVTIGDNSQIHSGTVIGNDVTIGQIGGGVGVFIGKNVTISNNVVILDGDTIPNDTMVTQ